jgi:hypothetical protein
MWGLHVSGFLTPNRYGMMWAVGLKGDRTAVGRHLPRHELTGERTLPAARGSRRGAYRRPAGSARWAIGVGDDGGSMEGRSSTWGGRNRRHRLLRAPANSGKIPATGGLFEVEKWSRRSRRRRGGDWCEDWRRGCSPFIGARGGRGVLRGQAWQRRSGARRDKRSAWLGRQRQGDAREPAS